MNFKSYLNGSTILQKLNLFKLSFKDSKILNFLNKLNTKVLILFWKPNEKLNFWWLNSFMFKQLTKEEQEIRAFENSKIFNCFLSSIKTSFVHSYFKLILNYFIDI